MATRDLLYARLAALECALVAGLRLEDAEGVRHIASALQDRVLDQAAVGAHASTAFRSGFTKQRRRLAARIGAPIVPTPPDRIM